MIQTKKLLSLVLPLLIVTPSIISAKILNNKQLAGPPEEFDLMQQAQPQHSAFASKTALIPILLQQSKSGNWQWQSDLAVDNSDFNFMLFANGATDWQVELVNPITNEVYNVEQLATEKTMETYGIAKNSYGGEKFTFNNMDTGNWHIRIQTATEPDQFKGFILFSNSSKYQLTSYKTNADQIVDHNIHFVTQSTTNEQLIEVLKDFNPIDSAFMSVTAPDGSISKVIMHDDGLHGDNLANDGLFGGSFKATQAGDYNVQINAKGTNPDKTPFFRTSEHTFPVIEQTLTMSAKKALTSVINDNRLSIAINIDSSEKAQADNRYRIIAEVWGLNNGEMVPVSWISTITDMQNGQLHLELDSRWIAMAKATSKFELRNLRIEDANYFIPLVTQKSMPLSVDSLPKSATKSFNGNITNEMMMGVKPVQKIVEKSGSTLMLVHGYCSSDVWGSYQHQFSNSAKFTDFNQNRSHDDFAQRIRNFGSTWSSFGIVAHSQGGAASLHLYTYYWSGLDYSTSGKRMIQSVGTPYQGTPIAGNLAALGNVFGVGCGYNSNLTTSGAASWLSGIPTWARNKVNYFTTSNTDIWWQYNYCSLATDLFLSDPDDGVIEQYRGQLSGASNRGHKTGWCHTSSMSHDAQTSDSSRNYSMSANANR